MTSPKVLKSKLPETCHQVGNVRPAGSRGCSEDRRPHRPTMGLCRSHVNPVDLSSYWGSCHHVPTRFPTVDDTVVRCSPGLAGGPRSGQIDLHSAFPVARGDLRS